LETTLKFRFVKIALLTIPLMLLAACDSGGSATPVAGQTATTANTGVEATPTAVVAATTTATVAKAAAVVVTAVPTSGPAEDTAVVAQPTEPADEGPSPTAVTAISTGEAVTALKAFEELKPKALAWQPDARLIMLADVRPDQAAKLLGVALGDPDVNEPTPHGLGRNWALIAFSPSTKGAIAIALDGTQTDLVKEGALTDEMVQAFGSPDMEALDLSRLDHSPLAGSDALTSKLEKSGLDSSNMSIAMLAPDSLGLGPLPTPQAGGAPPKIAYELFSVDPNQQRFVFFDAITGAVLMDSSTP